MTEAVLEEARVETRPAVQVPVVALVWAACAAVFVALRIAPVWHTPVSGAELVHLSGAWQARVGVADDRFVSTLFQSLTVLSLHWTTSEVPARLLALVSTATIPGALYLLRGRLGEAGALLALILLTLDGPAITAGSSASAMGFDLAITIWLFVAMTRPSLPVWVVALIGFTVATAGPIPLALVAGWAVVRLARRDYPHLMSAAWCAGGIAAGIVLATFRFGLGVDGGLRVPPFDLFAASYSEVWSTATTLEIAALYSVPIIVAGIAAVGVAVWRMSRARSAQADGLVLIIWAAFAALFFVSSLQTHSAISVVALTTPLALILGPALVEALSAMWRADWYYARWLVPGALLAAAVALMFSIDWARNGRVGDVREQLLVAGLCVITAAALAILATSRESAPTIFAALIALVAIPMLSAAFGIGLASSGEPSPSPVTPQQARELRGIALQTARDKAGLIVVNDAFKDDITWPFRDSGSIVVASRAPADASILVWPGDAPPPEGFARLEGDWQILQDRTPPTGSFLKYLWWFTNRNVLKVTTEPVAVYVRAGQ